MTDERPRLLTIGELARRAGLTVRTIRYWSDEGVLHPVTRSDGGYRLYDAESVARLELIRTLRELGLGLDDVRKVLAGERDIASVAAAHVVALDAQIRVLRLNRAVLSTVAQRNSSAEEMALMNRLARQSTAERKRIMDEFAEEMLHGLDTVDPAVQERMRGMSAGLPDDPTPEQADAWMELAELLQDPGFKARMRRAAEYNAADRGPDDQAGRSMWFLKKLVTLAGDAVRAGTDPASPEADGVLCDLLGPDADRAAVLDRLLATMDDKVARYRELLSVLKGSTAQPAHRPEFAWVLAALRAHPAG
ncbi:MULTISPECIES: MerR family transcriptional regulator [unclassified Streptomyces]|uniref:MerR family transcriptional regulator n=1 Tax=unclassified Streptomyces TaxID=2593676 RepID=UPI000DB92C92|nr:MULTISPECIES: MerR family transcriptional regulator [unclassified Streptomyces]MYT69538.1 MerR family transcriptional regulator [Streptomyces sp. SID8367]RAJ74087.1 DNA-binding transcriptional MerR regulator [Streptomyces sp. PsTaAH-137]